MNENSKKSNSQLFLIILIGVTTLVISLIGATFSYFSARATATNKITGTAANVGLELELEDVTTNATGKLIPLDETNLSKAAVGDGSNGKCIDRDNNTVCKIYKITATNTSNATAILSGVIDISADSASTFTNLKWNKMTNVTTPGNSISASFPITAKALVTNESFSAGEVKEYYVMVYINNLDSNQSMEDNGSFTGTVTFSSTGGSEVKAAFSS